MAGQKSYSTEKKLTLVMTILKGEESASKIARKNGISEQTLYRWKNQFLEGGKSALAGNSRNSREKELEKKLEEAKKLIGEITMANDILKKILKS